MKPVRNQGLDVIVRIHTITRAAELERCLLSLIGQSYRPLTVHVVTQRFSPEDTAVLQRMLDIFARLDPDAALLIHNFVEPEPADARSSLINLGYAAAQGRYVYLLDCDDVTTPHGCQVLIQDLIETGTVISFGKVIAAKLVMDHPLIMTQAREDSFYGRGLIDMFRQNFCPIHSFVLDRSRMAPEALAFDATRWRDEDYDFLIRTCANYPSSFAKKDYIVGFYSMKDDGSNTIMLPSVATEANWAEWRYSADLIARRRAETLVSPRVQRQLGRVPDPALTVARLLEDMPP